MRGDPSTRGCAAAGRSGARHALGITQALSGLRRRLDTLQAEPHDLQDPHAGSVAGLRASPSRRSSTSVVRRATCAPQGLAEHSGVTVTVTKKGEARALGSEQEPGVFGIVQQALSNVEKARSRFASRREGRVHR